MALKAPNPFDQFDGQMPAPGATTAPVPQRVQVAPGANPDEIANAAAPDALPEVTDPSNVFDNPEQLAEQSASTEMSEDQFASALYDKFNSGESPEAILQWSGEVGRPIQPNENFYTNIKIRDAARRQGKPGKYGRTQDMTGTDTFDTVGEASALARQGGNTVLMNFGDEAFSAIKAIPEALRTGTMPWNTQTYEDTHNELESVNDVDWAAHPISSAAGVGIGAILSARAMPSLLNAPKVGKVAETVSRVVPGAGKLARTSAAGKGLAVRSAVGGAEGTAYGAAFATGEGDTDDRFKNTGSGAALGAAFGTAIIPLIAGGGRLIRPIREYFSNNSSRALAERAGLTEADFAYMEAEAERLAGLGVKDVSLLDILPERVRGVVGSAGRHESARDLLQDVAAARRTELPDRVSEQAASEIGGVAAHPDDLERGITTYRNKEMDAAMEPLRDTPLPLDHDTIAALATGQGRRALRAAIDAEPDLARRAQLEKLQGGINIVADIDPRLPESARRQIMAAAVGDAFNINASDRISRELFGMAEAGGTDRTALSGLAKTIQDAAKQDDGYATAMRDYATRSKSVESLNVGRGGQVSQNTDGSGFLSEEPDRFARQVAGTRQQPAWKYDTDAEAQIEEARRKVASRFVEDDGLGGEDFMSDFELDDAMRHPEFQDAFVRELRGQGVHEDVINQVTKGGLPGEQRIVRTQERRELPGKLQITQNLEQPNAGSAARPAPPPTERPYGGVDFGDTASAGLDDFDEAATNTRPLRDEVAPGAMTNEELARRVNEGQEDLPDDIVAEFEDRMASNPEFASYMSREFGTPHDYGDAADEVISTTASRARAPSKESVIERFKQSPGEQVEHNLKFTLDDGRTMTGSVRVKPNSDVGIIYVAGIDQWGRTSNTYGPAVMKSVASQIRERFPQIRYVAGSRVTGARARAGASPEDPYQAVPARDPNIIKDAPTERELAKTGSRYAVDRAVGEGPGAAKRVADDFVSSPNQRKRTEALIGEEGADRLGAKMKAELDRVYRAERQATKEGPAREGGLAAVESGVNTLYNPGPISIFRETARFLHKIGMTEKDARWIVKAATDPRQMDEVVKRLQKLGMDKVKAQAEAAQLRAAVVSMSASDEDS